MAITRYAGDRFTTNSSDTKPTGVLDGAYLIDTGNLTQWVRRTVGGSSQWNQLAGGGGGGGTPGGANTQVQFNNAGAFGGSTGLTFDGQRLYANNLQISGIIYDSNNSYGEGGMVLTNEGTTGVNWKSIESVLSGVGGSGVANYVARWSDEDTITSGVIQDDGTAVGINQAADPDNALAIKSIANNTNPLQIAAHDGDSLLVFRQTAGDGRLSIKKDGGIETIRLDSDNVSYITGANFGLGTAAPAAPLDVQSANGDSVGIRVTAGYKMQFLNSSNNTNSNIYNNGASGVAQLDFQIAGATKVTIDNDGDVGIGTTTPSAKLFIKGDSTSRAFHAVGSSTTAAVGYFYTNEVHTGTTTNAAVSIRSDHASSTGQILHVRGDGSGDLLTLDQGGTSRVVVKADGDVDILNRLGVGGAHSGSYGLYVHGTSYFDEVVSLGSGSMLRRYESAWTNATTHDVLLSSWYSALGDYLYLKVPGNSVSNHGAIVISDGLGTFFGHTDVEIGPITNSGTAPLTTTHARIGATSFFNGSVGIGTTAPGTKLYVLDDTANWAAIIKNENANGYGLSIDCIANTGTTVYALAVYTGAGTGLFVRNTGNVGIGTAEPVYALDIYKSVTGSWLSRIHNTATSGNSSGLLVRMDEPGSSGFAFATLVNGNYKLAVKPNGNVGIGTNDPAAKLHILSDGSHDEGAEIFLKHNNNDSTDVVGTILFGNNAGGVAMIQGGTTGANNTGYISFSTDNAGTSSEKVRIIGDGKVGIGTDAPVTPLHVNSDGSANGTAMTNQILRITPADGNNGINIGSDGTNGLIGPTNNDTDLRFLSRTGGTYSYAMTINGADGNVGIGTTDPGGKLESYITSGGEKGLRLNSNFAGGNTVDFIPAIVGVSNAGFSIDLAGTNRLVINSDGNLGIGTNAPASIFHIHADSASTQELFFDNDGTGAMGMTFRTDFATDAGRANFIHFDAADDGGNNTRYSTIESFIVDNTHPEEDGRLTFSTMVAGTDTETMHIVGGNVGIGTDNPGSMLQVDHSGGADVDILTLDNNRNTASDQWGIKFQDSFRTRARIQAVNMNTGNARAGLAFEVGFSTNTVERMRINDNGNVGIGTDNPQQLLHINGSSPIIRFRDSAATGTPLAHIDASGGALKLQADSSNETASSFLTLEVDGSEHVRVIADGKVGIGTTTPDAELQIMNNDSSSYRFGYGGTSDVYFDADDVYFRSDNGGVNQITKKGGSLGIGVVNAEHKLHVAGDAIISGYLYDSTNSTGVDGYVLTSKEDGPQWQQIEDVLSGVGGNGTANYIPKWEDEDTLGDSVIAQSGTAIGIGTAAPAASLHIAAQAPRIRLEDTLDTSNYSMITADNGQVTISADEGNAQGNSAQIFKVDNNEIMRMNGANVGIGTNAPLARLMVGDGNRNAGAAVQNQAGYFIGTKSAFSNAANKGLWQGQLHIADDSALAAGIGGAITFGATQDNTNGTYLASIESSRDNATSGQYGASMIFRTRTNGSAVMGAHMVIASGGSVGIGTTSPNERLHVYIAGNDIPLRVQTDNHVGVEIKGGASHDIYLLLADTATNAKIGWDHSATALKFNASASFSDNHLVVKSTGVGIGIEDPSTALHVIGQGTFDNNGANIILKNTWSSGNHDILFAGGSVSTGAATNTAARIRSLATAPGGAATGDLMFTVNSGDSLVDALYIQEDGNVGIGTASPDVKLSVRDSTADLQMRIGSLTAGRDAKIRLQGKNAANSANRFADIGLDAENGLLQLWTPKTSTPTVVAASIDSSGNVGIGTTSPSYLLHAKSSGSQSIAVTSTDSHASVRIDRFNASQDANLIFQTASVNKWRLATGLGGNDEKLTIYDDIANVNMMSFKTAVGVGVGPSFGTNEPTAALHVLGDVLKLERTDYAPALKLYNNNASPADDAALGYLQFTGKDNDGTANMVYSEVRGGVQSNTNTAVNGYLSFLTTNNGTAVTEAVRIKADGNVGVGLTVPLNRLQVIPSTSGGNASNASEDAAYFGGNELGGIGGYTGIRLGGLGASGYGTYIRSVKTSAYGGYWNEAITFSVTRTGTSSTVDEVVRINSGGNVGIGTTVPAEKLHVDGGGYFEGDVVRDGGWHRGLEITTENASFPALYFGGQTYGGGGSKYSGIIWTSSTSGNTPASRGAQIWAAPSSAANTDIYFGTNNAVGSSSPTEKMRIRGDGKVGIGTGGPSALLHIRKIDLVDDSRNALLVLDGKFAAGGVNSGDEVGIAFRVENSGGGAQQTTSITSSYQASYNSLNLQPAGGKVGIGTNNPLYTLHVKAAESVVRTDSTTGTNRSGFQMANTGGTGFIMATSSAGNGVLTTGGLAYALQINKSGGSTDAWNAVQIGTKDIARMTIDNDGYVGIGTTGPDAILHLYHATSPKLLIQDTTNNVKFMAYAQDSNVHIGTNSAHDLYIDVNTSTNAIHILQSNGTVDIASSKMLIGGSAGTNGYVLTTDGSGGIAWAASPGAGSVSGTGTTNTIPRWTGTASLGDSIITVPSNTSVQVTLPNSGGATQQLVQKWTQTLQNTFLLNMYGGSTDLVQLAATNAEQNISIVTEASGSLSATTSKGIYIKSGGNVGIGTTNPATKLYVGSGTQSVANLAGIAIGNGTSSYSYFSASDQTKQYIAGVDHSITYTKAGNVSNHDHSIVTNNTNRIYILAGGNVGIGGVTNPTGLLQIGNNYTIPGSSYGGNDIYIASTGSHASYDPYVTNTDDFRTLITISDSGTTGPTKPGLILYNDDTTAGGFSPMLLFAKRETGSSPYKAATAAIYARSPLGTGDGDSWIDGELIFATAGAATNGIRQRMVINKEGLVGIGTNAPSEKLDIEGSLVVNVANSGLGEEGIFFRRGFSDSNKYNISILAYAHDGAGNFSDGISINGYDGVSFCTGDSTRQERMRIVGGTGATSGYVGIGEVSPGTILHIKQNDAVGPTISLTNNPKTAYINFWGATGAGADRTNQFEINAVHTGYGITLATKDYIRFKTDGIGAADEAMRINSDGSVGIGTTAPSTKLQVKDSVDNSYESGLSVIRSADNATTWINVRGGATNFNNRNHAETAGLKYRWFQDGTEKMVLNTDGHLGIGITNPGSLLAISGNSDDGDNACALAINDEDSTVGSKLPMIGFYGGGTMQGRIRGGDGTFAIAVGSTPTTAFSIDTTSRKITFGGYGSGTHTGTATYKLSVDSNGDIIETAIGGGAVDGSGTANKVTKWTDADTIGNSQITDNGTSVGINQGSPNAANKLEVNGRTRISGDLIVGSSALGQGAPAREIWIKGGGTQGMRIEDSASSNYVYDITCDFTNGFRITDVTSTKNPFNIQKTTGHVGIGTTAPTKSLDVNGSAYFNDDIYFGNTVLNPASGFSNQTGMGWDKSAGQLQIAANGTAALEIGRHTSTGTVFSVRYASAQKASIDSSGNMSLAGTLTEASSLALKENIEDFTPRLDIINKIRPVKYNKKKESKKEIGLIAEELAELFPELVEKDKNGNPSGVNYSRAVTVLLGGFKELYKEVQELKKRI